MFVAGLSPWIAVLAGLVPGIVLAVVAVRSYQRKLNELAMRMEALHRSREQTDLVVSRRQAWDLHFARSPETYPVSGERKAAQRTDDRSRQESRKEDR